MASKQRARAPKNRAPNQLVDLGIFEIPDLDNMGDDDIDIDDSALESELEAILSGKSDRKPARPKKKVVAPVDIEKMAAECIKDISDDENDDDENLLNDPDLLNELKSLSLESPTDVAIPHIVSSDEKAPQVPTPAVAQKMPENIVTVLDERLKLYNNALAAAKAMNDNSKIRRYSRAIKTLEQLLKSAKLGKNINEEDIPPVVSIPKQPTQPTSKPDAPKTATESVPTDNLIDISSETSKNMEQVIPDVKHESDYSILSQRRDQYKIAALEAKRAGDKATALNYMKIFKGFDEIIESMKNGDPVDLSNIPPPPMPYSAVATSSVSPPSRKELDETQTSSAMEAAALSAASEPEDPALFAAPPAPTTILEALEQRLEKYLSTKAAAEAEGNTGKVRRLQRIIKSYQKAITDFKAGRNVDFEELPTPPGFAPIPVNAENKPNIAPVPPPQGKPINEKTEDRAAPVPPKRAAPDVPSKNASSQKPKVQRTLTSTCDKQLEFLLERQKLFRQAAMKSKQSGDLEQAKQYLKMSKGFDSMIEACRCGLPVDVSNIPTPPQLIDVDSDFVIVDKYECSEEYESSEELLEALEKDLTKQIELCTTNKEHFLKLGDVSSASKFEKLGLDSRKDLSVIRHLKKTGQSPPKFHYETRLFSIVQCHTDLGENDLEVTVERGINLPAKSPDDLDSYVKVDFPIPSDAPQKAKTHTVRDTNNPIFQLEFKFQINRKSRAQLRQFKRQAIKLEVWSKGGFLRSDTLLGTANIKLVDLESKCTIHECFELMDNRKATGGRLEVKVRIRQPLLAKQVEEVREKWLVIGS